MNAIWQTVTSPLWLVTTVVFGLLLNVISGYAKDWIDRFWAVSSKRRRDAASRKEEEDVAMWAKLASDPDYRAKATISALREELLAYWFNLSAVLGGFAVLLPAVRVTPLLDHPVVEMNPKVRTSLWLFVAVIAGLGVLLGYRFKRSATHTRMYLAGTEHMFNAAHRSAIYGATEEAPETDVGEDDRTAS